MGSQTLRTLNHSLQELAPQQITTRHGGLVYNLLYPEDANVQKFIPIILYGGRSLSIPLPLRGLNHYCVDTDEGYEDLCRHLAN